jgi:hypothetical protein
MEEEWMAGRAGRSVSLKIPPRGLCKNNAKHFHATGTPKMQSQKRNFTILQLQDFLVNYELYEMFIPSGFYI